MLQTKRGWWKFLLASIVYLGVTCVHARLKPLWYDELVTIELSSLSSFGRLWQALASGVMNDPPVNFIAMRVASGAFGTTHIGFRMVPMLGFGLLLLCLYRIVALRAGARYGWLAVALASVSGIYDYAYEARPYGLLLGWSGLAIAAWQQLSEPRHRFLTLAILTVAVAACVSTQYFGILVGLSLAVGELFRSLESKRWDRGAWAALLLGGSAILFYLPLLGVSRSFSQHVWQKADFSLLGETYSLFLSPLLVPLLLGLIAAVLWTAVRHGGEALQVPEIPRSELGLAVILASLPVWVGLLGKLVTGTYASRYALSGGIGVVMLICWYLYSTRSARLAAVLSVLLAIWFTGGGALDFKRNRNRDAGAEDQLLERSALLAGNDLPVVVDDGQLFLKLYYYASAPLKGRLTYVADIEAAGRLVDNDTTERNLSALRRFVAVPVEDYSSFSHKHHHFLIYGPLDSWRWLPRRLEEDGASMEYQGPIAGSQGLRVTLHD